MGGRDGEEGQVEGLMRRRSGGDKKEKEKEGGSKMI